MDGKPVRAALVFGTVLVLCGALLSGASGDGPPATEQASSFLGLAVGGTTAVEGAPGTYERVLLKPPPDAGEMPLTGAWEISADLAIRLGALDKKDERWQAIRRNLALKPEDLIVWGEVVDAVFVQIGKLKDEEARQRSFGFRVAFPGKDTPEPEADVALTFSRDAESNRKQGIPDAESELQKEIAKAMTGIEGFVEVAGGGLPPSEVLPALEIRLLDGTDRKIIATGSPDPDHQGYFKFLDLPLVDPVLGSDYYLQVAKKKGESAFGLSDTEQPYYAPVVYGKRTRVVLPVVPIPPPAEVQSMGKSVSPWFGVDAAGVQTMVEVFTERYALLGAILEQLPDNPGLHLGVVAVRGSGAQPIYAVRKLLKQPERDRRAQFVPRGEFRMRVECLTPSTPKAAAGLHYLRVVWAGHAQAADLKLQSRPITQTPWGISVGVVPSVDPALYSLGASYKLMPTLELLAGVGLRQDNPTSLVYGITVDVDRILGGLLGGAKGKGEQ